jgi:hypothetical protein
MTRAHAVLFAGPSAHGLPAACLHGIDRRGPARRGDIAALVAAHGRRRAPKPAIVFCDGVFQSDPAVSHAELCDALDAGWRVWGVSSLGAIRAWEMRAEGLRGFGWVYTQLARRARAGADLPDDEMALLHLPEAPHTPLTEALIDLRHALARRAAALGITPPAAARVTALLREVWFGERSAELMADLLVGPGRVAPRAAAELLAWMHAHPVKRLDLQRLLQRRPWAG